MIELGADPNQRGPDGSVVVHGATFFGLEKSLEALVESGADVNVKNAEGQTALDLAASPLNKETEEIMTFVGGMFKMELDVGKIRSRRPELIAYLKSKGAKLASELVGPESTLSK